MLMNVRVVPRGNIAVEFAQAPTGRTAMASEPFKSVARDPSPANIAERIFSESPYRSIRNLKCSFNDGELTIGGRVPSYYLKQLAQIAVRQLDGVDRINNIIEVPHFMIVERRKGGFMQDFVNALREVEFFHDIANDHLERVAAISRRVEFPAHHVVFHEDELAKDVFVILSGRVSLVYCAPRVGCRQLMEVGPGELIGWSPLVGRSRLSDTAQTLTPTKAIAMDGERILAICAEDPRFGFDFMHRAAQTLASRLNATRQQLFKLNGDMLPEVQLESD